MADLVWGSLKGRRSYRRPRTGTWSPQVLCQHQPQVQQDELEALEALCFLSAGITQLPLTEPASKQAPRVQQQQRRGKQGKRHATHKKQKPARHSRGSETSSGDWAQLGLPAQAAMQDIHPAALVGPELVHLLQLTDKQQQQQGTESSDTQLVLSATPMLSDEHTAAQSRQSTPGAQLVPPSPSSTPQQPQPQHDAHEATPAQQEQQQHVAHATPPAAPGCTALEHAPDATAQVQPSQLQPGPDGAVQQQEQQQQVLAVARPPVKGCCIHVYIAKMIHAQQQQQQQDQSKQQQQQLQAHPSKRPQQQGRPAATAAEAATAAAQKKRRVDEQQPRLAAGGSTHSATQGAAALGALAAAQQHPAAAVQHILLHTLLQQQGAAGGVSAVLGHQLPGAARLLHAMSAAGGLPAALMPAAPLLPAAVAPSAGTLNLLPSLPPAVLAAAAACPQLLQPALGAAVAPLAAVQAQASAGGCPPGLLAGAPGAAARPLAAALGSVQGTDLAAAVSGFFGAGPGAARITPVSAAVARQLQGCHGNVGAPTRRPFVAGVPGVAAGGAWPGADALAALLGAAGMQPAAFPARLVS